MAGVTVVPTQFVSTLQRLPEWMAKLMASVSSVTELLAQPQNMKRIWLTSITFGTKVLDVSKDGVVLFGPRSDTLVLDLFIPVLGCH